MCGAAFCPRTACSLLKPAFPSWGPLAALWRAPCPCRFTLYFTGAWRLAYLSCTALQNYAYQRVLHVYARSLTLFAFFARGENILWRHWDIVTISCQRNRQPDARACHIQSIMEFMYDGASFSVVRLWCLTQPVVDDAESGGPDLGRAGREPAYPNVKF